MSTLSRIPLWLIHWLSSVSLCVLGWDSSVGAYTRVEGTPNDPNPDKPFSKIEVKGLFNNEGQLNPSITVIGKKMLDDALRTSEQMNEWIN